MVSLTKNRIDPEKILRSVRSQKCGGIALFLGVVRDHPSHHKLSRLKKETKVTRLDYSCYQTMAIRKMKEIENKIISAWKKKEIGKICLIHRLGRLKVGDISVGVAVSSGHRKESLEACRYAIDQIKLTVPIFKKEYFSDGSSTWVSR
ncbi:MAG: molybdenum cofactor biosynthesis protein MoaE [Elusimicrobia bacterium]|nr:molybdenum cofactor biosynthesis protein MoaE [Elusimicrobiota bacterium]MBI4217614.1 molybdenum cofactor biosynthesis protein MoaE [Elusimicrobiota bacterium]